MSADAISILVCGAACALLIYRLILKSKGLVRARP